MDVVMGTANPNRAVIAQLGTTQSKPLVVELVDVFGSAAFIPIAFIDTYLLATMDTNTTVTEKVWRISKDSIDGVILYLRQPTFLGYCCLLFLSIMAS